MNTEITKEKRKELLAWLKRHEEYTRENTIEEVNINLKYEGYIKRQQKYIKTTG